VDTISHYSRSQVPSLKFQNARHSFEGAIGAIDCSHVAIIAPRIHEEAYVNHHGYHSLNVQMVNVEIDRFMQSCFI